VGETNNGPPAPSNHKAARPTVEALSEAKRLPADFLKELGLRDLPGGGVAIPYNDATGEEIALKQRTALKAKEGSYWPKGQPLAAYGLWRLDEAHRVGFLIVVEGESDCWSLWHHRLPALGLPGAGVARTLEREHVEAVAEVYVHREPDLGGGQFVEGVRRRLADLGFAGKAYELRMPEGVKDPADLHARDPEGFKAALEEAIRASTPIELPRAAGHNGRNTFGTGADAGRRRSARSQGENGERQDKRSHATLMVSLALDAGASLFHDPEQAGYATVPVGERKETWPLKSNGFKRWLAQRFYQSCDKAPGGQAVADAVAVLEGQALFDAPELSVHVRLAEHQGRIYLDLADESWSAVEISAEGWRVVPDPPVKFRRPRGLAPLPVPQPGGRVEALRPFVNVAGDADWRLLVAWLVQALRPRGPYPVLCLHGEQGCAKSTTARAVRSLIDPNTAPLRCEPRDERDLMIAACNGWLVAFDNLSRLPGWLSDALCRLATGGGFATRELYTDREEVIFDAMRPCVLTSIEELASRGDLLERAILLRLPRIGERDRRTEREFWEAFEAARPGILGGLLDAVSAALAGVGRVRLNGLPRMADFACWAAAAEGAFGWPRGAFMEAYGGNQRDANELALEASPLPGPLRQLAERRGGWEGTATELLKELTGLAGEEVARRKDWPKRHNTLSGQLRRLAPNLWQVGILIEFDLREPGRKRTRTIRVTVEDTGPEPSSAASAASAAAGNAGENGLPAGAGDDPWPVADDPADDGGVSETPTRGGADNADDGLHDLSGGPGEGGNNRGDAWEGDRP
jgi:hypothetical protein